MPHNLTKLFATFFYFGYFPFAPGSMASIAGALLAIGLYDKIPLYLLVLILITIIGFLFCSDAEEIFKKKDPSYVVIDEVSGMMISFLFLPLSPSIILTTYFLFRAFDMFKIYPIRKLESLPGAFGIMMDDILAGIYTNITMHIAIRFAHLS